MTVWIAAFTSRGIALASRLGEALEGEGEQVAAFATRETTGDRRVAPMGQPLSQWTRRAMGEADGIVFVGACGIAVRAVAPWLQGKDKDPAVVAMDENGRFAVSLLSGHVGGANDLARRVAALTGAQAVVTTATDSGGRFPVDDWAVKQNLVIPRLKDAKRISMAVLEGEEVGFLSRVPWKGSLPSGLVEKGEGPVGICVSWDQRERPFAHTLNLVPRSVVLGIGCRKGTDSQTIASQVKQALESAGIPLEGVTGVASIDLKAREEGLLAFCRELGVPLTVYSAGKLAGVGGSVSPSAFVQRTTGVDNVCERAALLLGGGPLLLPKTAGEGVTVAASCRPTILEF